MKRLRGLRSQARRSQSLSQPTPAAAPVAARPRPTVTPLARNQNGANRQTRPACPSLLLVTQEWREERQVHPAASRHERRRAPSELRQCGPRPGVFPTESRGERSLARTDGGLRVCGPDRGCLGRLGAVRRSRRGKWAQSGAGSSGRKREATRLGGAGQPRGRTWFSKTRH